MVFSGKTKNLQALLRALLSSVRGKSKLVYPFEPCPDWFMDALAREAGFKSHDKSLIQNRLLTIYLSKIAKGK
ncbi:hypothetical protein [uncultured phage]|nr:hypothetical protein [uncultured phage]